MNIKIELNNLGGLGNGNMGAYCCVGPVISLRDEGGLQARISTFLHELTHAMIWGDREPGNENTTILLEKGLMDFFTHNAEFVKRLADAASAEWNKE